MREGETGQVTRSAAEVYEEFFVPALFEQWADRMVDAAAIESGHRVLDVACGTGVLARAASGRAGPRAVVGLDVNAGMLAVARRKAPGIDWRQGRAEALPFDDESFDRVVSQFALMFFEDRAAAIREMLRVVRPGGRVAIAVWASLAATPGYAAVAGLLERLFGEQVADALRAPFCLGDRESLGRLFAEAGIDDAQIATREGTARFASIQSWMFTDVKGWTLADQIDDTQFELLLKEAAAVLQPFVKSDGTVAFDMPAHIVSVTKH